MNTKIKGSVLFSLGLVLVLAFLIYVSMGYNQLARLVPLVVLVPGLFFALLNFGLEVRAAYFAPPEKPEGEKEKTDVKALASAAKKGKKKLSPQEKWRREWIAIGWLLGFFVAIMLLGQMIAIPLFVVAFMRFFGHESWRASILYAVVIIVFIYGLFIWGLRNELFPGILPPMITG